MSSKTCTKCGEHLPTSEFYAKSARCKPCDREKTAARRRADPEKVRAEARTSYYAHRDVVIARVGVYKAANPSKVREWERRYRQATPTKQRAKRAAHEAAKLQATPAWADRTAIENIYAACPPGYHIDHIVPLRSKAVCGLHCPANLQPLQSAANCSKGNRWWPDMWEPE